MQNQSITIFIEYHRLPTFPHSWITLKAACTETRLNNGPKEALCSSPEFKLFL